MLVYRDGFLLHSGVGQRLATAGLLRWVGDSTPKFF